MPVNVTVDEAVVVNRVDMTVDEFGAGVTYEVRLVAIPVPEVIAELKAAPADGVEVIVAATSLVADALTADEISLATDDATDCATDKNDDLGPVCTFGGCADLSGPISLLLSSPET